MRGRHDKRALLFLDGFDVLLRDRGQATGLVLDFLDHAELVQLIKTFLSFSAGRLLNGIRQRRNPLPEDLRLKPIQALTTFALELDFAVRKSRKGRQHAKKEKARRVQQMTKLRQKAVRRAAFSSLPLPSGGRG